MTKSPAEKKTPKPRMHDLLMRRIAEFRRPGYTSSHNLVLREIADRCNAESGYVAWPSVANIAERTWLAESTIRPIIRQLEKDGAFQVCRRHMRSSQYRIIFPVSPNEDDRPNVTLSPNGEDTPAYAEDTPPYDNDSPHPIPQIGHPIVSVGSDYGDRMQTVRGISKENLQNESLREPVMESLIDKDEKDEDRLPSGEDTQQNEQGHKTAECLRLSAAPLESTYLRLFPKTSYNANDIEALYRDEGVTKVELIKLLLWLRDSNHEGWNSGPKSSAYLLDNFGTIDAGWQQATWTEIEFEDDDD